MFTVTAPAPIQTAATQRSRAGAGTGGFAGLLAPSSTQAAHATGPIAAIGLLAVQEEATGDRPPRRRRPAREAARAALDSLGRLQHALLSDGAEGPEQELVAAAEEMEAHAAGPDAGDAALCRALALRLRVELAKRDVAIGLAGRHGVLPMS